jgi:hypothetical protein
MYFTRGRYPFALEGDLQHRLSPRGERALLPNLTHLRGVLGSGDELRSLMHILSNRLVSLRVDFGGPEPFPAIADYVRLMEEIMIVAPNTQHLALFAKVDHWPTRTLERAGTAVADFLATQSRLQHLETNMVIFTHLAPRHPPMTFLTDLHLLGSIREPGAPSMNPLLLPSLRRLRGDFQSDNKDFWASLLSVASRTIEESSSQLYRLHLTSSSCSMLLAPLACC